MEIYRIVNNIRNNTWLRNLSFRKSAIRRLQLQDLTPQLDDCFFQNKNITISGEFFPMGEETLKNKLISAKTNVMPKMSAETDILICGKFPDWNLVQEAKIRAIKVIFLDKASDLFTALTASEQSNAESELTFNSQFPLGI